MSVAPSTSNRFIDPENLPPTPIYIFRGHGSEITTVKFIRKSTRLVSGYMSILCNTKCSDTDGWVVVWLMTNRRPTAVWKAHDASVLSVREWGSEGLITYNSRKKKHPANDRHGRDGKVFG